jgi:hypothetical protein
MARRSGDTPRDSRASTVHHRTESSVRSRPRPAARCPLSRCAVHPDLLPVRLKDGRIGHC